MAECSEPNAGKMNVVEEWTRWGISAASVVTSVGFSAAQRGTQLGFGIAKGVTSGVLGTGGTVIEMLGAPSGTSSMIENGAIFGIEFIEKIALLPIHLGQSITSTSLVAASGSIDILTRLFGSHEASFSLGAFVTLVRREWNDPVFADHLPEERGSVIAVGKALITWAALQRATRERHKARWAEHIEEIHLEDWVMPDESAPSAAIAEDRRRRSRDSRITITEDLRLPDHGGQIISADFGEQIMYLDDFAQLDPNPRSTAPNRPTYAKLRLELRRLSKMCLAGYGGAGLLFFGVPLPSRPQSNKQTPPDEEALMTQAVQDSEVQAHEDETNPPPPVGGASSPHSWWDIVQGKHDQELFEHFAKYHEPTATKISTVIGMVESLPRFWVLTDHSRRQVVLVLRGTFSLNELAVDLTCDSTPFEPHSSFRTRKESTASHLFSGHTVHSGMLRLAQVMGATGKPVHQAVAAALRRNRRYELVLCGHSLGAGIAALLAMMWADPTTCLTVPASGLSVGRRVSAYCFAPPCVSSPSLSRLCENLVTSFIFSNDVVSRLSLGSVRNLTRACFWLCDGKGEESCTNILSKAVGLKDMLKLKDRNPEDKEFLLSVRKTLEANMHLTELFPTGTVLWAVKDSDISLDNTENNVLSSQGNPETRIRLFKVNRVEKVFEQMIFASDMLSSHMPQVYDTVLHEFL